MITVDQSQIRAVLLGGEWLNVTGVDVDFAEYVAPDSRRYARGPHLTGTLGPGGPNAGQRLVTPLSRVEGIRTGP
jgi:hypothetical protein